MSRPLYNFRLAPEAVWLLINTVLGTLLVQLLADLANINELPPLEDLRGWAIGFAFGAVRTALGALLALATGGAFLGPGEQPTKPTSG